MSEKSVEAEKRIFDSMLRDKCLSATVEDHFIHSHAAIFQNSSTCYFLMNVRKAENGRLKWKRYFTSVVLSILLLHCF